MLAGCLTTHGSPSPDPTLHRAVPSCCLQLWSVTGRRELGEGGRAVLGWPAWPRPLPPMFGEETWDLVGCWLSGPGYAPWVGRVVGHLGKSAGRAHRGLEKFPVI